MLSLSSIGPVRETMRRAIHLPATTRYKELVAFTFSVFLFVVAESAPARIQVETSFESKDQGPSVITDVRRENIISAFSARDVELWRFQINEGVAVILWDEAGQRKFPPSQYKKTILDC
jgi:hypothetical protein